MGESTFPTWWELHVRVARGESLTADETVVYQARNDTSNAEDESELLEMAKHARHDLTSLASERAQLERRHQELDAEIRLLESRMAQQTGRLLGVAGQSGRFRDDPTLLEIRDQIYRDRDSELPE